MRYTLLSYDKSVLGNDLLVVPIKDGLADLSNACHLNRTAAEIWSYCEMKSEGFTTEDIANAIKDKYRISSNVVMEDCIKVVDSLVLAGLIKALDEN